MDECKILLESLRDEQKRTTNLLMLLCKTIGADDVDIAKAINIEGV
jgi:hypothetical protein